MATKDRTTLKHVRGSRVSERVQREASQQVLSRTCCGQVYSECNLFPPD